MVKNILVYFCLLLVCLQTRAASVWLEAENFTNKGGWVVDQQFMDLMGSPYLMAHGMGVPVEDASAKVQIPESGAYCVYVRTFNWTSPWHQGEGPGKFRLKVGNKRFSTVLGCEGNEWKWQYAGKVDLKKGETTISLTDMTGFNGRCDAIYLTTDSKEVPPADKVGLEAFRRRMLDLPVSPVMHQSYDLVVIGGGIAGMCAAAAASRLGCKVALVNDRPVLGGNNSSEVRVHLGGHIEIGPNKGLGRMIREFGHSRKGNAQPGEYYEDEKKAAFIAGEKNITLFSNYRAVSVTMDGTRIGSVIIKHVETGEEQSLQAPLFSDCTGDGTIGYLAGADYRIGRESRSEFGEELAPPTADRMTMGASAQWYSEETDKKTSFPEFSYGVDFNDTNCEKVTMGEWKWETGMNFDQISDAERIRDYGLMVVYSNWSFLKNHLKDNGVYKNVL